MSFIFVLFLFLLWRVFDFLILYLAPKFIPYLGFFPYASELKKFHLPQWVYSLGNFDGVHYLKIASQGYEQYEQAFFPLYPILIRLVNFIINNALVSGLLISNILFLLGLWVSSKYQQLISTNFSRFQLVFLLLFPTSFFFGAVYTEGLFFFLVVASLYFLEKKNYFLAGLFGFFASLASFMGIFLLIPFVIYSLRSLMLNKKNLYFILYTPYSILCFFPILGFLLYAAYLWQTTGDLLFFLNSQPIFGAQRSVNIILLPQVYFRYLKIFFTSSLDFRYLVSLFEFIIFTFVFVVLVIDLLRNCLPLEARRAKWEKLKIQNSNRFALSIFSLANLLVPALTGTFSSIPRYALLSISFFLIFARIKNHWIKLLIAAIFLILHIIVLGFFGQGYFVS